MHTLCICINPTAGVFVFYICGKFVAFNTTNHETFPVKETVGGLRGGVTLKNRKNLGQSPKSGGGGSDPNPNLCSEFTFF